jgi:hypothetical protein
LIGVATEAEDYAADIRARTRLEPPPCGWIFPNVFSEDHPVMAEQSAWLEKYLQSFEEGTVIEIPMAKAINEGLRAAMLADNTVLMMGEDIGQLGGVFRVTEGLLEQFGPSRVMDTPLAESGIVGSAIGLAMRGYRPVCEIQFDGFVYPAFDQIVSQLAKMTRDTREPSRSRLSFGFPTAVTLELLNTTRKAPRRILPTQRVCGSYLPQHRMMRIGLFRRRLPPRTRSFI